MLHRIIRIAVPVAAALALLLEGGCVRTDVLEPTEGTPIAFIDTAVSYFYSAPHEGRINMNFLDGHAASLTPYEVAGTMASDTADYHLAPLGASDKRIFRAVYPDGTVIWAEK